MNETTNNATEAGPGSEEKGGASRRARSIRFSDSEWQTVEEAAAERDMNAAAFVRHAALGVAGGRYGARGDALPAHHAELIERIFRSTHILATLKRDEMVSQGRGEELDRLVEATREFQNSILEGPDD